MCLAKPLDGPVNTADTAAEALIEADKQVAFKLRGVNLGLDDENGPITSCIVEHKDVDLAFLKKLRAIKGNPTIAKQALDEAIAKHF